MVVPLKLTQFYGHSVPRPRIYTDVKLSEKRVDPPPSVNEALLLWAANAHWSMGGLCFKRLRAQGKLEGSVRRLRAQLEEEGAHGGADKTKTVTRKTVGESDGVPEKRKRDEEAMEATPVKKLRKREIDGNDGEGDSPGFVPATLEKKKSKVKSVSAGATEASEQEKKVAPSSTPAKIAELPKTPIFVPATAERRRSKLSASSGKILGGSKVSGGKALGGSKSPVLGGRFSNFHSSEFFPLTRSAKKMIPVEVQPASPQNKSKRGRPPARKILVSDKTGNDGESSDSDDGLEEFLKQQDDHPLRRSGRLVKESREDLFHSSSDSDSA